jgi:ATP-binding cassette subfamily C protein CydD
VPQRPYLFRGSVSDNIRLALPGASDRAVLRAAELAGVDRFVGELSHGYDTVLGERGAGLSAGQVERLALARAFLKDAPLLILDEPTSALDPESEALVRTGLQQLKRDRTVLVVAHRINTVRAADQIAVLEQGRLAEVGSHERLRHCGGAYARFTGSGVRRGVPA